VLLLLLLLVHYAGDYAETESAEARGGARGAVASTLSAARSALEKKLTEVDLDKEDHYVGP
jgi:DNA-directed RNA polymerase specialized sigma24 family protein